MSISVTTSTSSGCDAERVGDDLRAHGLVALPLGSRCHLHRDSRQRRDDYRRPLDVARLRQGLGALRGCLGQRDVAHVRDRRLDDAGEPDADQPALCPRRTLFRTPLAVAGELKRVVEASLVVARVVERAGGRAVRERRPARQGCAAQFGRIEAEAAGGGVHRPFQGEVELRAAEAAVEAGGTAVREDDAVAGGDVPNPVGASQ